MTRVLLLHVVDRPEQFAGAERVVLTLARHLSGRCDIELSTAVNPGTLQHALREVPGLTSNELPPRGNVISLGLALRRLMSSARPDVVSSHHRLATLLTRPFRGDARVVHTVHVAPVGRTRVSWFGDVTVCVGEHLRGDLASRFGIDPARVRVIVNGVDDYADVARVAHTGPLVFGVLGRFTEQKGHRLLIDALHILSERGPAAGLVRLFGEGELEQELRGAVASHGLDHIVEFAGWKPTPEALGAIDVLVLPSQWEGVPLVLLEAWSAGLPVIATAVDGVLDVADPTSVELVPARDAHALAGALESLARDPARREALARAGRRRYEEGFTAQRMAMDYLHLFETVAAQRR